MSEVRKKPTPRQWITSAADTVLLLLISGAVIGAIYAMWFLVECNLQQFLDR